MVFRRYDGRGDRFWKQITMLKCNTRTHSSVNRRVTFINPIRPADECAAHIQIVSNTKITQPSICAVVRVLVLGLDLVSVLVLLTYNLSTQNDGEAHVVNNIYNK